MKIKNTLHSILVSAAIFAGCREIPTTPEPEYTLEKMVFGLEPKSIDTKNGEFSVSYKGGNEGNLFNPSFGTIKIMYVPDSTTKEFKVNIRDKNTIWLSKKGATTKYSQYDPSIHMYYLGKFSCITWIINRQGYLELKIPEQKDI